MSATSSAKRLTPTDLRGWQNLQGANYRAQNLGGHVRIHRCGLELLMSEQDLDHADIDLLLKQMRGKAVA